uniref:Secreted protein n=1 Tax=Plectus sambesii TaxID=2011161 RepID=A0A914UQB3_9BILA
MLRLLIVLTALAVVVLAQIGQNTPCVYPYLEEGKYKSGKTSCINAATDCEDTAVCMQNYMTRNGGRLCCKQKADVKVPTCPKGPSALLNPNGNKAMKGWMMCNPASRSPCPNGYKCVQSTTEFTTIAKSDLTKTANSNLQNICCK